MALCRRKYNLARVASYIVVVRGNVTSVDTIPVEQSLKCDGAGLLCSLAASTADLG
jgi:hypothetical protein